jgi:hypothetical protein
LNPKTPFTCSAAVCCLFLFLSWCCPEEALASPWADKEGYGAKTGGKFVFGLKHTLFSVFNPWAEAHDPVYESPWTGFCAGIGKSVVYTAAGAIQLVTFPIPVDFPNIGLGMHAPANHIGVAAKGQKKAADLIPTEPLNEAPVAETDAAAPSGVKSKEPVPAEMQEPETPAPAGKLTSLSNKTTAAIK